jgi:hypothetical protein
MYGDPKIFTCILPLLIYTNFLSFKAISDTYLIR